MSKCILCNGVFVCLFVCSKQSIIKQLLDSVFVIFGIIKVSVSVISPVQSKAPRQRPFKADNTYLKRKNAKVISTRFRALWL